MSNLQVTIDRKLRIAKFVGSGTYLAKEQIKQLGQARFFSADKSWEVSGFEISSDALEQLFPGILVNETSDCVNAIKEENLLTSSRQGLSVSQFLGKARGVLRAAFPGTICIYGVLSDVDISNGGRVFLELKENSDSDERVRCVIWQDAEKMTEGLRQAGFKLERDLQIMFEASVQLGKKGGYLSLSIEKIVVEYTIGKLAALRDQTNERLRQEGLFGKNKQTMLSFLPRRLGIITSSGGTVINDFRASLDSAQFGFELFWVNAAVQGSEAKRSIVRALQYLQTFPSLDAILIFRGGGSPAELAVFNDYEIARAVCLCPIPIFSAVGHEEDQSSVQDVSYRAFGVPKDLGRFFGDIILEFRTRFITATERILTQVVALFSITKERLEVVSIGIARFLEQALSHLEQGVKKAEEGLPKLAKMFFINRERRFVDLVAPISILGTKVLEVGSSLFHSTKRQLFERAEFFNVKKTAEIARLGHLVREIELLIEKSAARVEGFHELLQAVSPEMQLRRGFVLLRSMRDKSLVTRGEQVQVGEEVMIEFHDTQRNAKIIS